MKLRKCPRCGSGNISRNKINPDRPSGTLYDACHDCLAIWESVPKGEQYKRDGELIAFHKPCDNCAFTAGSPESQDKTEWRKLIAQLRGGGMFFCHKGVPLVMVGEGSSASFDFPKGADGKEDKEQMRLCRGFLNAWSRWVEREMQQVSEEAKHD